MWGLFTSQRCSQQDSFSTWPSTRNTFFLLKPLLRFCIVLRFSMDCPLWMSFLLSSCGVPLSLSPCSYLCNCHVLSSSVPLGPLSSAPQSPLCNGKKPLGYSSGNLTPEGDLLLLIILIVLSVYTVLSAMLILKFVASPGGQTTWRRAAIGPGK